MSRKGSKSQEQASSNSQQNTSPSQDRGNGNAAMSDPQSSQQALSFSDEEVAERAYQIFEREGRSDGRDMDHWLKAEQELRSERQQPPNRLTNSSPGAPMNARPEEAPRSARRHQQQPSV